MNYQGLHDLAKEMTKRQVIKALVEFGCTDIVNDGKFCIIATLPNGNRGRFDPRDLWIDMQWHRQDYFPVPEEIQMSTATHAVMRQEINGDDCAVILQGSYADCLDHMRHMMANYEYAKYDVIKTGSHTYEVRQLGIAWEFYIDEMLPTEIAITGDITFPIGTRFVWSCQDFNRDGLEASPRELEIFDNLQDALACIADISTSHWSYHVGLDGLSKVAWFDDLGFGFVHFIDVISPEESEGNQMRSTINGRFVGYRTIAQATDHTDAQGYRAIESWPTLDDCVIGAWENASHSVRRANVIVPSLPVKWVIAQVLVQSSCADMLYWRTVEVIKLNYDGSRIVHSMSDTSGIPFDLDTDDSDFGPMPYDIWADDNYIAPAVEIDPTTGQLESASQYLDRCASGYDDNSDDSLWRLITSSGNYSHSSDASDLNAIIEISNAARHCLLDKGYTYSDSEGLWTNHTTGQWITLSIVLDNAQTATLADDIYVPSVDGHHWMGALGDNLRSDVAVETALNTDMPVDRQSLSSAHIAELTLQLGIFTEIANCAFEVGHLDRAESASVWVIALASMLG